MTDQAKPAGQERIDSEQSELSIDELAKVAGGDFFIKKPAKPVSTSSVPPGLGE
jgi:hypothetical protein